MGNYGIKVTDTGYDVATATLLQQTFNSEKNCVKIATTGTISDSISASTTETKTVAHGLGFTPCFLVWLEEANDGNWYFMHQSTGNLTCNPYSDATNLTIPITNGSGGAINAVAYYVIFADKAG